MIRRLFVILYLICSAPLVVALCGITIPIGAICALTFYIISGKVDDNLIILMVGGGYIVWFPIRKDLGI